MHEGDPSFLMQYFHGIVFSGWLFSNRSSIYCVKMLKKSASCHSY